VGKKKTKGGTGFCGSDAVQGGKGEERRMVKTQEKRLGEMERRNGGTVGGMEQGSSETSRRGTSVWAHESPNKQTCLIRAEEKGNGKEGEGRRKGTKRKTKTKCTKDERETKREAPCSNQPLWKKKATGQQANP
jgi:hypothetical protein